MTLSALIPLILLGLAVYAWQNARSVHERAAAAARNACAAQDLQLLDATVVLYRVTLERPATGRIALRRTFVFAYSTDGADRRTGFVIMLGNRVEQVGL